MNYERHWVRRFFAALTPDSRPCQLGVCPIMVAYPSMRRCATATGADPALTRALDQRYKDLYGSGLPWSLFEAGEIVKVIDSLEAA